jgi:sugar phosphate isomerase/epimerase
MPTRRSIITQLFAAGLAAFPLTAIEPLQRKGQSRMQLGVAAYSFGKYFEWNKGKPNPSPEAQAKKWNIMDFIDWCADHDVPGAELTSYFFPPEADAAYFLEVRRYAYLRGVQLAGTAVGNTFTPPAGAARDKEITYVKQWIDNAALMGAPHIRVFAGAAQKGQSHEQAMAECQSAYAECLDYAGKKGVFLGLENHHGIVAQPEHLIQLVQKATNPWAGINFDSGNFHTADPYADLAKIAPYAINVQLKMDMQPEGKGKEERIPADIPRILKILRDANYQGWFTLEYERPKEDPFIEIPKILAALRPLL